MEKYRIVKHNSKGYAVQIRHYIFFWKFKKNWMGQVINYEDYQDAYILLNDLKEFYDEKWSVYNEKI